jgi:PAS domain S-box-containing protein
MPLIFFNISLDIMIIASREKFEKINPAMVETLGYTEEELLMHPFLDFVHADDKENTQKEIETIREGSQTLEFKIDGFVKTILLNGLFGLP